MLRNYIKITLRNLVKSKIYSSINISGLAVGMACVLLISLFIQDELNYDSYHTRADRIYRLTVASDGNDVAGWIGTPAPLAPAAAQHFAAIESFVRIDPMGFKRKVTFSHGERRFYEDGFILADRALFDMFDFELLQGDPEMALSNRSSIVISRSIAEKYFGSEDAMGKILNYDGQMDFVVSGVMADVPENSHFTFDMVAPFEFMNEIHQRKIMDSWGMWNYYTYVLLANSAERQSLQAQSTAYLAELMDSQDARFYLQPLTDIYLRSRILRDPHHVGDLTNIYMYGAIAVLIMLIACINFMNLYTANSEMRGNEVGVRKVLGARRGQLVSQFVGESVLLSVLALPIAVLLAQAVLPAFNQLTGKSLQISLSESLPASTGLLLLTAVVGVVSGSYPAFFLSALRPVTMLNRRFRGGSKGLTFRNVLVVFQFAVAIILIAGTIVVNNQMAFVRTKKLGYDRENIVNVPLYGTAVKDNYPAYRNKIIGHSQVVDATATSFTPSVERWREGSNFEGRQETDKQSFYRVSGDYNFTQLFGMELRAGRAFDRTLSADLGKAYILNEAAVKEIGWQPEEAINKSFGGGDGRVIGVVRDFNFRSLRRPTAPLAINVMPRMFQYVSVKVRPGDLPATLDFLEASWHAVNPGQPFEYYFYDQEFDKLYKSDLRLQTLFRHFTLLSIFLACMGLFGLSLFAVQQRRKEIGIRKVLGASVASLATLVSRDFVKLVVVANVVGWPVAALAMNSWLDNFAYRIHISLWTFLLAGGGAVLIALLTVSSQAVKSAIGNPTETLRHE